MKKIYLGMLLIALISVGGCTSESGRAEMPDTKGTIATSSSEQVEKKYFYETVDFTSGVTDSKDIQGDSDNSFKITGTIESGDKVFLVNNSTGSILAESPVTDGEFSISHKMDEVKDEALIFTSDPIGNKDVVEKISDLKNKISLLFKPDSDLKEKIEQENKKKAEQAEAERKKEEEDRLKREQEEAAKKKEQQLASRTKNGVGDSVTDTVSLDSGYTVFSFTNNGSRNFIVRLYDEEGNSIEGLVNEIGEYNGKVGVMIDNPGNYMYEVKSSGEWSIVADQTIPNSAEEGSVSGNGDDVKFIKLNAKNYKITGKHSGTRNFIVRVNDQSGIFNEIGMYEGTTIERVVDDGIYAVGVKADGEWIISFE